MKSRLPAHRHPNGHWCHCPFGNAEPYSDPREQEKFGSRTALWVEASKIDWLRSRPDHQAPEHQRFLDRLELAYPNHDALYPWLARERKKGRVKDQWEAAVNLRWPQAHDLYGDDNYIWDSPLQFVDANGYQQRLEPDHLDQINDWMKYMKQAKKGVDLMKHEIGPALREAEKNDIGGENVHTFDNGYWVAKLRNKRDLVREGNRMHHCIGSQSMGYIDKNDNGEGLFYSLRTPDNQPVGTAEIGLDKDSYFKCPNCHKFAIGEQGRDHNSEGEASWTSVCEHCGHVLHRGYGGRTTVEEDSKGNRLGPAEGVETFPMNLKGKTHPDAKYTSIEQMFGPHDNKMDEWHEDMFNQYFGQHGHGYHESDGEPEEEEEYEPWWDSYYTVPGASTPQEYFDHRNGEYESYTPEEYDRAQSDAYENEVEPPELEVEDPDWDSIFDHVTDKVPDPEEINNLWNTARDHGDAEELNDRAKYWLETYHDNLDPYGKDMDNYPNGNYAHEEYVARNLEHQLGRFRDPQTGEIHDDLPQMGAQYPEHHPSWGGPPGVSRNWGQPQFPDDEPYDSFRERHPYQRNYQENPQLTWDFDARPRAVREDPMDTPPPVATQPWAGWRSEHPVPGPPQGEEHFMPIPPKSPEEFFTPGQESTEVHQRALPLQWKPDQSHQPNTPFNPASPEMFSPGQQQGALWPTGWYIDYQKQRAQRTQLPQHLFMPEHFGYHVPENQTGMWSTNPFEQGNPTKINTQHEDVSALNEAYGQDPRPTGQWTAKTSGPWTETEDKGGRKRPKHDPEKGYGVWDTPVHEGVPHLHGRVVVHNQPSPPTMPGFDWRIPVVYDKDEDRLYVGQRGMEHGDMMNSFHKNNPWGEDFTADGPMLPGYIDADSHLGGGLHFFKEGEIPNEDELHDWAEDQYGVRNSNNDQQAPIFDWDDDHEASYHPRQEDEWVAEDEPVFSALIPEPRWKI